MDGKFHMTIGSITLLIFAIVTFAGGAAFVVLSLIEKEKRAAVRGVLLIFPYTTIYLLAFILPEKVQLVIILFTFGLLVLAGILFFVPTKVQLAKFNQPIDQVDEREIIFARA